MLLAVPPLEEQRNLIPMRTKHLASTHSCRQAAPRPARGEAQGHHCHGCHARARPKVKLRDSGVPWLGRFRALGKQADEVFVSLDR